MDDERHEEAVNLANPGYDEKDIQEILFPKDYYKSYLEPRYRANNNKLKRQTTLGNQQIIPLLEDFTKFQTQFTGEISVLRSFIN